MRISYTRFKRKIVCAAIGRRKRDRREFAVGSAVELDRKARAFRIVRAHFFAPAPTAPKSISILLTSTLALAFASARSFAAVLELRVPARRASASRKLTSTSFSIGGFSPGVAMTLAES